MIKIMTNSDKELVADVRAKIKANNGHCACAILFNEDNKCMCKEFKEQLERGEPGYCHCGLYEIIVEN